MSTRQPIHSNKKYLALFYDKCDTLIDLFTDEEVGQIIKAAIEYDLQGKETTFDDRAMQVHFAAIKKDIDLTTEKADKISEQNRANVSKRYKKNKASTPCPANDYNGKPIDEWTQEEIDEHIEYMATNGKM